MPRGILHINSLSFRAVSALSFSRIARYAPSLRGQNASEMTALLICI